MSMWRYIATFDIKMDLSCFFARRRRHTRYALVTGVRTGALPDLRDASGLPLTIDGRKLDYGPNRRLIRVSAQGKLLASYAHNAFGHRIARRARTGGGSGKRV